MNEADGAAILLHAMRHLTKFCAGRRWCDWEAAMRILDQKLAQVVNERNPGGERF